ncbi:hypothetical protein [Hymenobacter defluvii]|uniref:Uncharacterized protein n=1 Tax=Hymenobacter defluvii TaxID=2054411 RepID=A0ABS3TFA9_9BACT|nr:hypothetical protein [Hymenobacter defluvii]MBO3272342.1 hypothetical protein [Hymenobacter defluvii]
MAGIEIHGADEKFLDVTLNDVLPCLHAPADIQWRLWVLEAWSAEEWTMEGLSCEAYENAVNDTPGGRPITREQMQQLADAPAQLVNMVLLGSRDFSHVPLTRIDFDQKTALYAACDYVIEIFDSSYVIVYSVDESFIECLCSSLRGVKTIQ